MTRALFVASMVAALSLNFVSAASAQNPGATGKQLVPAQLPADGQYSPRLKAWFVVRTFQLPGFAPFRAVRLTTEPDFDSPLLAIGLRQGDVITRLDGIPVTNFRELENHFDQTTVRFIRQGTSQVQNGTIFIDVGNNGNGNGSNIERP